jgi:uncharacterized caspase-like protein
MPAGIITSQRDKINNTYSLHVGIDKYLFSRSFKSLQGCVRDARDMLSAFNTNNKKLLLDEEATRKNILGSIEWYMQNLRNRDLLIITISAHGAIVNNDLAIVTYDVDDNLLGTVLSMSYTMNAISEIAKNGGKVLLVLDACQTGAINFDIAKYSGVLSQGGISCMNSCGPREYAYECEFSKDIGRQGAFTKHIIDGLSGKADFDNLGIITLRNLYDYAYEKVNEKFPQQHPLLIGTLEGNTILRVL